MCPKVTCPIMCSKKIHYMVTEAAYILYASMSFYSRYTIVMSKYSYHYCYLGFWSILSTHICLIYAFYYSQIERTRMRLTWLNARCASSENRYLCCCFLKAWILPYLNTIDQKGIYIYIYIIAATWLGKTRNQKAQMYLFHTISVYLERPLFINFNPRMDKYNR